jgi:hypothetical protein
MADSHLSVENKPEVFYNSTGKYYTIHHGTSSGSIELTLPESQILFNMVSTIKDDGTVISFNIMPKPDLSSLYQQIGFSNKSKNIVFVYPIFTQAAYSDNGFYDYYSKKCDSRCLTVSIPSNFDGTYSSSIVAASVLNLLNYSFITDIDVDKNPGILQKYDTVILLHNEYVTRNEFYAITNHSHVIYLYPNALYAEVKSNYTDDTITLIKGHGYPDGKIQNGFGWKNENTRFEYDLECKSWNFTSVDNGKMLNCYPDYAILYDKSLLNALKESSTTSIPEFGSTVNVITILSIIGMIVFSSKFKL